MKGKKISDDLAARICLLLMRDDWNMSRVSKATGVSRATVYRVTGGKKALLARLEEFANVTAPKKGGPRKPLRR